LVHLVAHSMGGLICRSLLQKIYPEAGEDPEKSVSRFFTYATPHGGIQLRSGLGFLEKVRDFFGPFDSDTFGPDRMYAFLTPKKTPKAKAPSSFDPRSSTGDFDTDRIFCAVGTNAGDYDVAAGLSSASVGPQSDGLVQIDAAYVLKAHRAYVHRCHSGRYGIVNSEEAFQNLERFLFGTIQAIVSLQNVAKLPSPSEQSLQLDVQVSVRGLPVFMNERTRAHFCPVVLNDSEKVAAGKPVDLFTQFLNARRSASGDGTCRFAICFGLYSFGVVAGKVDYTQAMHGLPNWYDTLLVDVKLEEDAPPSLTVWWTAPDPDKQVDPKLKKIPQGGWSAMIPLPKGIAQTLLEITDSVTLVGSRQTNLRYPSVPDVFPAWGALGGLHTALAACRTEWAIVVACDLPLVTAELFQHLASLDNEYDAVVPIQPDGRPQPLAALYRADPCRRAATELIEKGRRRPLDLLESVRTRWVDFVEIANLDQAERFFVNINTPEDYYGIIRVLRET